MGGLEVDSFDYLKTDGSRMSNNNYNSTFIFKLILSWIKDTLERHWKSFDYIFKNHLSYLRWLLFYSFLFFCSLIFNFTAIYLLSQFQTHMTFSPRLIRWYCKGRILASYENQCRPITFPKIKHNSFKSFACLPICCLQ